MATANTIRMALMKLLRESENNKALIRNTGESEPITMDAVTSARQQAREAQGTDPLATPAGRGPGGELAVGRDLSGQSQGYGMEPPMGEPYGRPLSNLSRAESGIENAETLFKTLMQQKTPDPVMLRKLENLDPYYADIVKKQTTDVSPF